MIWPILLKGMFRFDAESVHRLSMGFVRRFALLKDHRDYHLGKSAPILSGIRFRNPIGLAAGFDKNCEILGRLPGFGFGFAEIGTVTPRPQPGNPRPRLFRDLESRTVFNRMGFNSDGAEVVSARLEGVREALPEDFRVGVNIGKNKDTSLEDASADYRDAVRYFENLADYICINVSSPNTEGLRNLQNLQDLTSIVSEVVDEVCGWTAVPPVFLKLSPELDRDSLNTLVPGLDQKGIAGWVLTNTLMGTWKIQDRGEVQGGVSGLPLQARSREVLSWVRTLTNRPIMSSGGILTADDALDRMKEGADAVQIYSGWIFEGPWLPKRILKQL